MVEAGHTELPGELDACSMHPAVDASPARAKSGGVAPRRRARERRLD
jgi:hypothetical protein